MLMFHMHCLLVDVLLQGCFVSSAKYSMMMIDDMMWLN